MSRREYTSKMAEYEKQYMAEFDQMVAEYMARPEVKAKRATKDAAEQAETSTLRGKTYWDTLYEVIKLEDLPLPMQCPQHSRGECRAKPHQYLSKPIIADAAWVLASICSVALSQMAYVLFDELGLGLRRRSLRGWPQKSCPTQQEAQPDSEGHAGWVAMLG